MNEVEVVNEVEKASNDVVIQSQKYAVIRTPEQYTLAADFLKTIKGMQSKVSEAFDSIIKAAHAAHKEAVAKKARYYDPLTNAEATIKGSMRNFQVEQEKIRQEAERKLQEAARKEEDRKRKIKEEQERVARQKAETARNEAERLKAEGKAKEAEEALIKAEKAEERANQREQEAKEVNIPIPTVQSSIPKIEGISGRKYWKAKVLDLNKVPVSMLFATDKQKEAHQSYFNGLAESSKGTMAIQGIEFYQEDGLSARRQ